MSDNTGDRAYARDAKLQPAVAWLVWALLAGPLIGSGAAAYIRGLGSCLTTGSPARPVCSRR